MKKLILALSFILVLFTGCGTNSVEQHFSICDHGDKHIHTYVFYHIKWYVPVQKVYDNCTSCIPYDSLEMKTRKEKLEAERFLQKLENSEGEEKDNE